MNRKINKYFKVAAFILSGLFGMIIAGFWFGANHVEDLLDQQLKDLVSKESKGMYTLDYQKLNVNLFSKNVSISGIKLRHQNTPSDSMAWYADADIGIIELVGLELTSLNKRLFNFNLLKIDSVKLMLTHDSRVVNKKQEQAVEDSLDKSLPLEIKVLVNRFVLTQCAFNFNQIRDNDTLRYNIGQINLEAIDLSIDPTKKMLPISFVDVILDINKGYHLLGSKMYELSLGQLKFSMLNQELTVDDFSMTPKYSMTAFAYRDPDHGDRTSIDLAHLKIKGIDYLALLTKNALIIDSIWAQQFQLSSYKNRKVPQKPRVTLMPYQALHQLPFSLLIKQIELTDSKLDYYELSPQGINPGHISFDSITVKVKEINTVEIDSNQLFFKFSGKALLMNSGRINLTGLFPNNPSIDYFEMSAKLGFMSLLKLNPIIEPLTKVRLKSGVVDQLDLNIAGNSIQSKINLAFAYSNLQIMLLKEKNHTYRQMGFASHIVNTLLIKKNNPAFGSSLQSVKASFKRNPYKSVPNYFWGTILEGLKVTAGLSESKQDELHNIGLKLQKLKDFTRKKNKTETNKPKRLK